MSPGALTRNVSNRPRADKARGRASPESGRSTFEFPRLRKRAKPAVAGRVQRRIRRHCLHAQPAATLFVEELPCIGPVEATDTH